MREEQSGERYAEGAEKEINKREVEQKEATAQSLEQDLAREVEVAERLEAATHEQNEEIREVLEEVGIDSKSGFLSEDVEPAVAKIFQKSSSLIKRAIKVAILSTVGLGLGGSLSSAVAQEAKVAIEAETKKDEEEKKINVKQAVKVCNNYVDEMLTIKGLSQAEGNIMVEYMVKAIKLATEKGQSEDDFKKILDEMMVWLKHVKEEKTGLSAGLSAIEYGLERIVGGKSKREIRSRAESPFEELDRDAAAMDIFLNPVTAFDQRIEALKRINIPDGGSVELNGIKIGRKGEKFYWIRYGNMGVELNEERTQKLVESYQKACNEFLGRPR